MKSALAALLVSLDDLRHRRGRGSAERVPGCRQQRPSLAGSRGHAQGDTRGAAPGLVGAAAADRRLLPGDARRVRRNFTHGGPAPWIRHRDVHSGAAEKAPPSRPGTSSRRGRTCFHGRTGCCCAARARKWRRPRPITRSRSRTWCCESRNATSMCLPRRTWSRRSRLRWTPSRVSSTRRTSVSKWVSSR